MSIPNPNPETPEISATEFADALRAVSPELLALAHEQLAVLNVDPASAVATVRAALRQVSPLAARIDALTEIDHEALAKLPLYTSAFWQTHSLCLTARAPAFSMPELEKKCVNHVARLAAHLRALVEEGVLPAEVSAVLADLGTPVGYKPNALAVSALVTLLRGHWSTVSDSTSLTLAKLDAMSLDATRLLDGVSSQLVPSPTITDALELRQRAFTLFARTYDELCRAVSFLRWKEDDASDFVPTIYGGHSTRPRTQAPAAPATAPAEPPVGTTATTPPTTPA